MIKSRLFYYSILNSCLLLPGCSDRQSPEDNIKPNILWLIAEDLGPDLGCYGEAGVQTPNLDNLANEGILYTNAYTTAPICSPSRSAFMTGMYQTTIGAHHHRSHRQEEYKIPEPVYLITHYFRQAGYFVTNSNAWDFNKYEEEDWSYNSYGKTDWNFTPKIKAFDSTDWEYRKPGQPFFAQINFGEVHRMGPRTDSLTVSPDSVEIPPYYPDHIITRNDWAKYLTALEELDKKIGYVITRLKKEGLLENTVIFFFGDNGRNHVRGKQWLYDGGIKIPLIVRYPKRFNKKQVNSGLVSTIDFAPTCLNMAGIDIPEHMQGTIFLGDKVEKRDYIYAARDRADASEDRIRCVRSKRFKYIRNYFPEIPYTQHNAYKELYYPVLGLMHELHKKNLLNKDQINFMAERKPEEELYDVLNDPHELNNLAEDKRYTDTLINFRKLLNDWIIETNDKGEIPEDPASVNFYREQSQQWYNNELKKKKF
jgi:N-sulfoglucosamine sulfohydrolase